MGSNTNSSNSNNSHQRRERIRSVSTAILAILDRHFLLTTIIVIGSSFILVAWQLDRMTRELVENAAINDAEAYNEAVAEFRTLYTSEVVSRVSEECVSVSHDYQDHEGAIPLPATMSILLGDRLAGRESHGATRLYSDYPFPWQENGGPQDDFEQAALEALRKNPDQPYYRFENSNGRHLIRYATADRMRESCIDCHNQHPDSPKTDWKAGDVRGVLAVSKPLDGAVADTERGTRHTHMLLGGVGTVIVVLFGFMFARLSKQAKQARSAQHESSLKTTEITLAKSKLEQLNGQLHDRALELDNSKRAAFNLMQDMRFARDAAEQATVAKSQFLANMSHEIRTPMTAILGFAETLSDNVTRPENIDAITTICRNSEHLMNVVNDVLDLSKVEAGKFQVELIEISPHELLLDLRDLMQVRADSKGLKWDVEIDGALPVSVTTDPTRLRQILINLVGNAIKFTEIGSVKLVAKAIRNGQQCMLIFSIVDTGIGMTAEEIDLLFQPFVQADNSMSRRFGGTGLGLAISKRFAELLGGDIQVKSEIGAGSEFQLSVAVEVSENVASSDELKRDENSCATIPNEKPLDGNRILLVEDGPDNQRLIAFVLRKAGAVVELAENGRVALDTVVQAESRQAPFEVILMDMQMPVMDGYTATRKLRSLDYRGFIIALTAHAMEEDRRKCLEAGCDDFATKPIDREQLIATVARYIASRSAKDPSDDAKHTESTS